MGTVVKTGGMHRACRRSGFQSISGRWAMACTRLWQRRRYNWSLRARDKMTRWCLVRRFAHSYTRTRERPRARQWSHTIRAAVRFDGYRTRSICSLVNLQIVDVPVCIGKGFGMICHICLATVHTIQAARHRAPGRFICVASPITTEFQIDNGMLFLEMFVDVTRAFEIGHWLAEIFLRIWSTVMKACWYL